GVTTIAGGGNAAFADGTGGDAMFNSPEQLAFDSSGNLMVADRGNNRLRYVTLSPPGVAATLNPVGIVTTLLGGTGPGANGAGYADGTGSTAQLDAPVGVTVDGRNNVILADTGNRQIRLMQGGTMAVTALAGSSVGFSDGSGTSA